MAGVVVRFTYLFTLLWATLHEPSQASGDGALGKGSEQLNEEETVNTLEMYKEKFAVKDDQDALRIHGRSLACSACRWSAKRFQNKVARKIKGKMSASQKREAFDKHVASACDNFPKQMAVVEKGGKEVYVDWRDAMANREGKVNIQRMSPEITQNIAAACRQLLHQEFQMPLWEKVASLKKGTKGTDVDFVSWLCGPKQADVCDDKDEEDDEDGDGREEL